MHRDKPSSKQSSPTTLHGRPIAYDREIFIEICRRLLQGEDLKTICAKPPMPVGPVFLGWVQDHQEAREIHRSVRNFLSDRSLAKELGAPWAIPVGEWEEEVRAKLERGHPVDYIDRKYIPPDWNKVYPLVGGPPVLSTEDMQAYSDLLNEFTQMLKPCDFMELIWTKEGADATWELAREAREKNAVPEQQYQLRLQVLAQVQRQARVSAEPATALDHSRGLRAGFKYHQALDIAQSRAMKRRDNALRQIARWRDGLGGKAEALSDKFVAEQALAKRYGVAQFLPDLEIDDDPEIDNAVGESMETTPTLIPSDEGAESVPTVDPADVAEAAPPTASADEAADLGAPVPLPKKAAEAASPRAPAPKADVATEGINWVGWLTGAESYRWIVLQKGAQKKFEAFMSKKQLVRELVVDCKLVPPERVCPELARYLPANAQAAPTLTSSAEERK
jgi:hypothetical protein